MSWQHQDSGHHDGLGSVPHFSPSRRLIVSSAATTTAPTSKSVNAYGPSQPKPAEWRRMGTRTAPPIRALPKLLALAISAPSVCVINCLFPRHPARGDALLTAASFAMVGWVMIRGLA